MKTIYPKKTNYAGQTLMFLPKRNAAFLMLLILPILWPQYLFPQRIVPETEIRNFNLVEEKTNKFVDLHAKFSQKKVYLQWFCSSDNEEGIFIISRSENQKDFKIIAIRKDCATVNQVDLMHSYIDKQPPAGIIYYRVMKVYKDGSYYYSDLENIEIPKEKETLKIVL